ncbi:MAG: hypothetical protein QOI38_1054 [Sphingomonadales bacterium]|jgi:hypothetical protein|nr:hypothetical protein [Sphingomonadales bacterium]
MEQEEGRGWEPDGGEAVIEEPPGGHPVLATLIGGVVLLFVAAGSSMRPDPAEFGPNGGAYLAGRLAGAALAGALIVWGIAYLVTIRRASRAAKIGSFAALLFVSLLATVIRHGGRVEALREDARTTAVQMKDVIARGEQLEAPLTAGSGPMSQMQTAVINAALADQQAFDREAQATGVYRILDLTTLRRDDPALRDCGRIDGLAVRARSQSGRYPSYLDAARAAAAPHIQRGTLSGAELDSYIAGAEHNVGNYRRLWSMTADWASEAGALCDLLGTRRWVRNGAEIAFASDADAAAANGHLSRINALAAEQQRLQAQARANARRTLDELAR